MSNDLAALEEWAAAPLRRLQPQQRRRLTREIAYDLRRRQRERIKGQQNPDGTPYAPRKPQMRRQQGAIRRKGMFTKLRTAKYLKARGGTDVATVGFSGRAAAIARIHHYGLRAKVDRDGPQYNYPRRALLGFAGERDDIADIILRHVTHG
ncbi:MAG: phage virion morphogenesis protein [Salinisphaeraceae bacterium]